MDQVENIRKQSKRWRTLFLDPTCTDNAWNLLQKDSNAVTGIVTFCEKLDNLLSGGVQLGQITEIAGCAGGGKTQICFQLSVDVQIPGCLGGVGGECVFIDTENTFRTDRLKQIAQAAVDHCHRVATSEEEKKAASAFTVEEIFSKIHYRKCSSVEQLLKLVNSLGEFVRVNNGVKLIIVDSVAYPFIYNDQESYTVVRRCQLQQRIKLALLKVALHQNVAIVLTNHVTTRFDEQNIGYQSTALGLNWGCDCATRLFLVMCHNQRVAYLLKSANKQANYVLYTVNEFGTRDEKTIEKERSSVIVEDLLQQVSFFQTQQSEMDKRANDLDVNEEIVAKNN